jgi:hypothetical protein
MKRVTYLISAAFLVALLAVVLLLALPTRAAQQTSPPPSAGTQPPPPTPPQDYLLALPIALPDPADIPAHLSPEAATEYARTLTERQAGPIQAELERLRAEGLIAGFEVRPDLHGVVVSGATPQALEELSRLPQVTAVMPYTADHPPACALAAAQALPEQVLGLSRIAAGSAPRLQAAGLAPQATDPSIDAYVVPGSTGNSYSKVSGWTTANISVTMRILRGGRVIATQSTTSYSNGWYSFYSSWQSCPTSGYNWSLRPGDVVEVTAHGNTVSTVIVDLRAWVDPVANTVAGRTAPGRSVEIWLEYPSSDLCSWNVVSKTVGTDGSGNFTANFGDFDRKAYATVYARDANGNSTYYNYFYAYQISGYFNSSTFQGYLKPEVDFTATLSRSGSIISTYRGRSDATNYYWGWFTDTIRAGDVISVSGGGVNIQYTATSLSATLDPANNRATGTTSAGRQVRASFYKRTSGSLYTACWWGSDCASTTASTTGAFTLTTDLDLVRGDYAYFYVYDAEGNYQYTDQYPVSAIVADLYRREVSGYWGNPDAGHVTVILKDISGTVKATNSWVGVDSWDGKFSTGMGSTISPTDIIEVTDGAVTETMTVQNLTARLNGATGHLTGNASNGHLVARLWDFRRESGYWYGYCSETNVITGSYDLTFGGAQVGGQDYVWGIWNTGPDGHYTTLGRTFYAFTVNAREGGDYVYGYSETPYTPVTVTLQRGGNQIAVYTTTSYSDGYYYGYLSSSTPVTITQGDIVQVQTGDGVSVSLPIPLLTANVDGTNNRVYGKSPANEPVRPEARRRYNWGYTYYSQIVTADGSGNYSASFNGLYWWDCSSVNVGHRCIQPVVRYYNAAGHQVWMEGPYPPPVGPDIYESDDISTTARAYTGIQSHTFHTVTDTDWVTFTVFQVDVDNGVTYRIETFNLGWGMATRVTLYDANMNWLGGWWGYENRGRGVSARWTPSAAGVYYLEIAPPSSSYGGYCDAVYDLMILPVRGQIYLPLVLRNYP